MGDQPHAVFQFDLRPDDAVRPNLDIVAKARAIGNAADSSVAEGTVIKEARAGFLWDDQVLRTAEVIVSKGDAGKGDR